MKNTKLPDVLKIHRRKTSFTKNSGDKESRSEKKKKSMKENKMYKKQESSRFVGGDFLCGQCLNL